MAQGLRRRLIGLSYDLTIWWLFLAIPENHEGTTATTEIGNDLPHHDLGGRRLDRSLADNLPVRRERSDYMGLAQLTERGWEYHRHRSRKDNT